MESKLQEAISKLPVIQKAHIYEARIEDVAEISFKLGYNQAVKEMVGWLVKEREENRKLIGATLNRETDYRARGKVSLINALLKYINSRKRG